MQAIKNSTRFQITWEIGYLVSWNYRQFANVHRERRVISVNLEIGYLSNF